MTQVLALATVVVALVLGGVAAALAGVPTETVRDYTDAVVRVLEDPALKTDDRRAERRAAVRKIAIDIFDVQETARRALGHHWQQRTPQEREEFVQLFADLLERTYIDKIDLFGGERLKFTEEKVDGEHAVVRAKVVTKQGTEVPVEARMLNRTGRWQIYDIVIEARMLNRTGRWQIYDIVIENISLIGNYRSQFDRIIRSSSYGELAKRLRMHGAFLNENARPRRSER
jgi:phospholipid transport system substrate-binding protein